MLASTSRADVLAQRGCCGALGADFLAQRGRCGTHRRLGSLLNANSVEQEVRCVCVKATRHGKSRRSGGAAATDGKQGIGRRDKRHGGRGTVGAAVRRHGGNGRQGGRQQ